MFLLLLTATVTVCFLSGSIFSVSAQQKTESEAETSSSVENTTSPVETRPGEQTSVWAAIWKLLTLKREQEPPLASRGPVCEIAPGLLGEKNVIWNTRPLFLWQGIVPSLEIYLYSPFSPEREQEILWSQTVTAESPPGRFQRVAYTGEALQPGQSYDWELVIPPSRRQRYTFQVMESPERDRIAAELRALEAQLVSVAATAEDIALQRANYFAQRDLWSDALQEIYSVQNPSAAFISHAQEILTHLCEPSDLTN
jgi:hypothetical protein